MQELAKVPMFQKLDPTELEQLGKIATDKEFPAGRVIFFQGDPSDSMFVITSGKVKVYQTTEDGREKILTYMSAGDILGEFAMFDGQPRSASAAADAATKTLMLTRKEFRPVVMEHPGILWKVVEAITDKLRVMNEEVSNMTFRGVPYRLITKLVQLAKLGDASAEGTRLDIKLSAQDLANMIGASRESVMQLMNQYQTEGLLKLDKNQIVIPDLEALKRSLEYQSAWS